MTWLLSRETVIVLAILGAIASTLGALLERNGRLTAAGAKRLNGLGYASMTISMILFIVSGFLASAA
ncbi:MAG TPA: hypothetical protein VN878_03730 [Usitatibacter sp.]|nr:hypothetical protein [Usitatibacter sp.]